MDEKIETAVQVIENATRADIRPGDHITWECPREMDGVTVTERHEGIARFRDEGGDWWTDEGMYIKTDDAATLTIRRTVQELPTEYDGAVIVPADGHEFIEIRAGKKSRRLTWDADAFVWYDAYGTYLCTDITPGTWKVDDQ